MMTNSSGTTLWKRDYYPFGGKAYVYGSGSDYEFCGKERDDSLALDYSWHRYYDYNEGRFTQVDPLWMKYPSSTPFNYANNNPMIYIDPDGKDGILAQTGAYLTGAHGGAMVEAFAGFDYTENQVVIGFGYSNGAKSVAAPDIGVFAGGTAYFGGSPESGTAGFFFVETGVGGVVASGTLEGNMDDIKSVESLGGAKQLIKNSTKGITVAKSVSANPVGPTVMSGVKSTFVLKFKLPTLSMSTSTSDREPETDYTRKTCGIQNYKD